MEIETKEVNAANIEEGLEKQNSQEPQISNDFTKFQRYLILLLIAIAGMSSPICSAIYFPALLNIRQELQTTEELVDITVSSFLFIMGIAPLMWGGLADMYGRKGVYIASTAIFIASSVGCALAPNINFLIVMRALQGLGSSSTVVIGIGTISDIFPRSERGSATGLFLVGPLIGPVIGPIIGGFVNQYLGWRYIFWILTGLAGAIFIFVTFFLPETLPKERKQNFTFGVTLSPFKIYRKGPIFNPLMPLIYLKHMTVALTVLYASIIFASYYSISSSQIKSLTAVYHLNSSQVGLAYIPLGIGNLIGSTFGGRLSDYLINRYSRITNKPAPPEIRLHGSFIGAISITVGLFMLGWFLEFELPLGATLFSQLLVGFGMTCVFSGTSTYLIDLFPKYSASITACNNCLRTISAGIIASVNSIMLSNLNYGWTFSLFGFLQLIGITILIILTIWGERIRTWESKI
ncbi:MFS general substrate transporter [Neoconidiobolus thromboides FSU 785]|nr:MFS general substrate transporter [Neoconidiobolus thromboides FSU 785]